MSQGPGHNPFVFVVPRLVTDLSQGTGGAKPCTGKMSSRLAGDSEGNSVFSD